MMISIWRKQAIDGMAKVFSGKPEAGEAQMEADVEKLHAEIGQLVVDRDFLVKVSVR